jgi:translation initiation factor IF-2
MATTGSRLVIGFNVEINQTVESEARAMGVEVRLYQVIYRIGPDLEHIANSLVTAEPTEKILGRADVIALFKSNHGDIILGCEVVKGRVALGDRFRIVDVAGAIHEAKIDSLHSGPDTVSTATVGQQVGLKVHEFQKARIGDYVEVFQKEPHRRHNPWTPKGGAHHIS